MSIRNRLMANRFGYDSQYTQMEAVSDYVYRGRDYYAMPDMEKRFLRTRSDYNTILSLAKENYVGTEDPDSYEARLALGQIIHQLYPTIDATYAAENAEELMYQATGYKTNVKGLRDQFVNTFHSAGSSLLASMKIANLYIQGAFAGYNDEEWLEKKEEAKKDLTKYAMNYRTDLTEYDNAISRLLSEPATATAEILPSMLPSLGISALALAVSVATGGSAIPATTAGLIKTWNTLSGVQKATAAASIGGRFFTSAMMEMGGSALDMMNAGFDDDVIFGVSALVGLTNGVLETVGDKAIDTLLKPFSDLANAAGRETANKIIRTSIKDTIREFRNETGKSMLSESTTEVLQEFSSMFGYNMAVNIQKERNRLPEGIVPYTAEDFRNAAYEVAKSTAMGTAVLGGASGMLRFAGRYAGGELRRSLQADKYTKADGATARIATSIIDHPETTISPDQDVEKQSPISVVRIGDRYRTFYTNDEENAAISRSKQVYVREIDYSTETAIGKRVDFDTVDMHSAVKRSVVENVINKGLDNGKLAGFTYYNKNLQRTTNPSQAAYISLVESKDSDPIMIPLSESSNITAVQLQKDIYGETIDKVTSEPEPESTVVSSSDDSSSTDSNVTSTQATNQPETIVADVDEQTDTEERETTFTDEDLVEAEAVVDDLVETVADESVETDIEETQISTEENQEAEIVEPHQDDTTQVEASQNVSENNEQIPVNTVTESSTVAEPVTNTENTVNTDTRTPEQKRIDEDTERRNQRNQARINAQNEWDQVQRTLTGTDSAKDVDVLTVYFSSILGQTRLGESAQAVEASARAAAEVAVGFAKASGMKGEDYFKTINAFMSEDFVPTSEDGAVYSNDNKLGWFLRDNGERYINIMRNADPSTLIHELGHHFLSVLTPDMPAYSLIHEVYAKSIEKDGGVIGRRTNEAFARDLEKYVYFRKSSNGRLNAIFQKLYDVAKALWQTLKGDERLSSQKVKMFDAIFAEEQDSTAATREVANAADKVMASDSETKMSDLVKEIITESTEEPTGIETVFDTINNFDVFSLENDIRDVKSFDFIKKSITEYPEYTRRILTEYFDKIYDLFTHSAKKKDRRFIANINSLCVMHYAEIQNKSVPDFLDNLKNIGSFVTNGGTLGETDAYKDGTFSIYINPDIFSPTIFAHEISHYFLWTLQDGEIKDAIINAYRKEYELDGNTIGSNLHEAFAYGMEAYIQEGVSNVPILRRIFDRLVSLMKDILLQGIYYHKLTDEQVALYDNLFKTDLKELARNASRRAQGLSIEEDAEYIVNSVDDEAVSIVSSEGVDLVPEAEPEEVSAGANIVEVPQTEEEKAAGEPVQKIEVESEPEDTSLDYVVEIDLNTLGDDPKFYTKKIREGKVDSKKLESQFKEKDNQKYFDEITEQYKKVVDSPIVGMGNKVNIYTAISSITGIPNLDTDFAEFFYAEDGGIYVLLKKDIRVNEDETETYLADKPDPKFWKIPLTGKDSIEDITYEYYLDNKIPEVVEKEYILDTEGNKIYREEVEAEPTDDKDKIDAEKFSDTEEDPDEVIDYDKEKRVKRTFKGYSDPFVTAIPFAVSYQNNPELYFSSNDTEAVREAAEMIEERLSDTELINTYSRFEKYINALKDKLEKDFDNEEAEVYKKEGRFDLEELKANYVQRGIADELQLEDPDASITDQFAAYLGITEKNIKDNMAGIPSDMQENVLIKIANDLIDTSKSYLATGKTLRNGLSNPNHFNKAVDLLRNLVQAISKSNNVTRTRDSIATMLRNSKAANALDTDKPLAGIWLDVYTAFQKDRNTGSVSEEQVRTLIDALVDEKGIPRFITETKDGAYYTSPLIVLSNFYSAKGENVNKSTDSFAVASERYLNLSQQLLKDKLQESGIVNISKDNADAAFQSIFAKIRNKMGNPFLQSYFENRVTMNKVEALSAALGKKIDSLKKQAEDTRKDPETIKKLMASEREIARLNESIAKLKESAANSKGDISELKKQLQKALKENDALKKVITDLNSIGSVADLNQKIQDLEHQADVEKRKYERMIEARNLRIAELNKRVDYLLNHAPEIKTARELQEELDTIIKSIYSRANSGNKRVGQQLSEIYDFLSSDVNTPYDSNIFESRWSEFSGFYDQMRRFVERVMIQDGKLVRNLNSLTVQELAELDDIVDIIVGFGTDEMNYRKMQEDTKWARRLTYAIRGIPKFKDLEFNHEAMDELIDKLKSGSAPGSVDDQIESGIIQKTISEFTQIENALKAINPALHNIIFGGGLVEGERIADNLNSAQEEYVKNVNGRMNEVAEAFTKYFKPSDFGLKVKGNKFSVDDFNIYQERVFRNKRTKLGRMSIAEFEAKHGSFGTIRQYGGRFEGTINLNPSEMWYELARRILSEEVKYRRDQIRFKNKPEDLTYANKRFKKIIGEDENTRIDKSYTMENIMGIYLLAAQKDGLNRLIINPDGSTTTNNLSIENILWVIDQFTDGEFENYRKFAHSLQHIISSRYGALSDVYYLSENELLENIPYYFTIRDEKAVLEEVNTKELKLHSTNVSDANKLDTSFLKERANPRRAADLNVISIAMDEIRDQEKYITQAVLLNRYSSMFRKGGDLELALENAYGEKGALLASSLRRWVGQIIDENNRTAKTSLERVISKLRGNMVRSVLWAAPSVILQQFPSYILVARRIGLNNATRYLFNTIHNRRSVAQFVYSKSKQMKDRARIETAEYKQRAGEFTKDPIFMKKLQHTGYKGLALSARENFEKAVKWGMDLQQKADTSVANAMWMALYEHYSNTMEKGNLSDAEFDTMVSEKATQEVLSLQPSQYAKDNAIAYNSRNEALKSLLLFTSSLNKEFNMIYEDFLSGRFNGFTREKILGLVESFMYISLVSLGTALVSGRILPDDDDDRELKATIGRLAQGTMSEAFNIIPAIGPTISDLATGEVYYDTGTAGTFINLMRTLAKDPEKRTEGQLRRAISKSFVEAFQLAGIPSNTPNKILTAVVEKNPFEAMNSQWGDYYKYIME